MQPRREASTAPRARRGARRRGPAAIAAAMVCVSLAVASSAPAGSAAQRASIEAPAAASILGGPGGILGVGPESGAADPRQALRGATRARAAGGGSGDRMLRRGRRLRGHGFVRDAAASPRSTCPAPPIPPHPEATAAGRSSATTSTPESDSTGSSATVAASAGSISPARREPSLPRSTTGAAWSARTPTSADARHPVRRARLPARQARPLPQDRRAGRGRDPAGSDQQPRPDRRSVRRPGRQSSTATSRTPTARSPPSTRQERARPWSPTWTIGVGSWAHPSMKSRRRSAPSCAIPTAASRPSPIPTPASTAPCPRASTTRARSRAASRTPTIGRTASCSTAASTAPSTPPTRPATPRCSTSMIAAGWLARPGASATATSPTGASSCIEIDAPHVVSDTFASGINNRGDVVGSSDRGTAKSYHGFLRDRRAGSGASTSPAPTEPPPPASTTPGDRRLLQRHQRQPRNGHDSRGFLLDRRGRFARIDVPGANRPSRPASTTTARSPAPTSTPPARCTGSCAAATASSPRSTSPTPRPRSRSTSTTTARPPASTSTAAEGPRLPARPLRRGHDDRRPRGGPDPGARHQQPRPGRHRHRRRTARAPRLPVRQRPLHRDQTARRPGNGSLATDVDDRGRVLGYVL